MERLDIINQNQEHIICQIPTENTDESNIKQSFFIHLIANISLLLMFQKYINTGIKELTTKPQLINEICYKQVQIQYLNQNFSKIKSNVRQLTHGCLYLNFNQIHELITKPGHSDTSEVINQNNSTMQIKKTQQSNIPLHALDKQIQSFGKTKKDKQLIDVCIQNMLLYLDSIGYVGFHSLLNGRDVIYGKVRKNTQSQRHIVKNQTHFDIDKPASCSHYKFQEPLDKQAFSRSEGSLHNQSLSQFIEQTKQTFKDQVNWKLLVKNNTQSEVKNDRFVHPLLVFRLLQRSKYDCSGLVCLFQEIQSNIQKQIQTKLSQTVLNSQINLLSQADFVNNQSNSELKEGFLLVSDIYKKENKYIFEGFSKAFGYCVVKRQICEKESFQELQMMKQLQSPFSIKLIHSFVQDNHQYIVMEKLAQNLYQIYLKTGIGYSIKHISIIGRQVIRGLSDIHSKNHSHYDIKPENIMFVDNPQFIKSKRPSQSHLWVKKTSKESVQYLNLINPLVKIIDFGLADSKIYFTGTPNYMAPEIVFKRDDLISNKVDIWSLGITMFEMYIGRQPLNLLENEFSFLINQKQTNTNTNVQQQKMRKKYTKHSIFYLAMCLFITGESELEAIMVFDIDDFDLHLINSYIKSFSKYNSLRIQQIPAIHESFQHLLINMLKINPTKRMQSQQCIKHQFFTQSHIY